MVRRRSRTSRKHYESDEPETDSDYGEDPAYDPAPKKYSLRQRKRALFTDDLDYDDDGVQVPPKVPSDDEEYHVEKEVAVDEAPSSEYVAPSTYINTFEPDQNEAPAETDELVDFEDMIRADIVVNKNRIDYDNVIQKTEIKVQPLDGKQSITPSSVSQQSKTKSKRGRKPKRRNSDMDEGHFLAPLIQEDENDEHYHPYKPKRERKQKKRADGEIDSSLLEPETEVQEDEYEDKDDADYNPDDDMDYVDIANCMQTEFSEYPPENFAESTTDTEKVDVTTDKHNVNNDNNPDIDNAATETTAIPKVTESSTSTNEGVLDTTKDVAEGTEDNVENVNEPTENVHIINETSTSVTGSADDNASLVPEQNKLSLSSTAAETDPPPLVDIVGDSDAVISLQSEDEDNDAFENHNKLAAPQIVASQESIGKPNDNFHNSSIQVNGTITHLEDPEVHLVHKEEIEEIDDDVLLVEDKKCDVIVLDD